MADSAIPIPYGRACSNCAKAKCKCLHRQSSGACERCHRLSKECTPGTTIRRRPGRKPVSRTAHLEEKLESLVTLLRSTAGTGTVAESLLQKARVQSLGSPDVSTAPTPTHGPGNAEEGQAPPLESTRAVAFHTPLSVASAQCQLAAPVADERLEHFRSQKLKYFPFVHIPPEVTESHLRKERPFLWLSILAASEKSVSQQQELGKKLQEMVAERVVVQHECSIDILLGLVGFLGWHCFHLGPRPFMATYSHLAVAVAQDLGIDKAPPSPGSSHLHPMAAMRNHGYVVKHLPSSTRTMEERRALLGCYLVTKSVSSFLGRSPAMVWNAHMDDCLAVLEASHETILDRILVQQLRLQRISDEAPSPTYGPAESSDAEKLQRGFQVKALMSSLSETKGMLSPHLPDDLALICRLHSIATELNIHAATLWSASPKLYSPDLQRIGVLSECLRLTRAYFDEILAQPSANYFLFDFSIYQQMTRFTCTIYRLLSIDEPFWDKAAVRESLDWPQLVDAVITKMSQVSAASGIINDGPDLDMFSRSARGLAPIKAAWEPAFANAQGVGVGSAPCAYDSGPSDNGMFDIMEGVDSWFGNFFAPGWDGVT